MPGRGYHDPNAKHYKEDQPAKENRRHCKFCGLLKFLLPWGVCGACDEDEDYQRMQAYNTKTTRLEAQIEAHKKGDLDMDWP